MNKQKRIIKSIFLYCLFLFFLVIFTHLIKDIFDQQAKDNINIWIYFLVSLFVLQILFIIYLLFQDRDKYIKTFWIIFTSFFPIYGHLIFIFFGKRYSNSQKIKDYFKDPLFEYEKIKSKSNQKSAIDFYSLNINRGVYGGEVKLYTIPFDGFDVLFNDIKKAKKSIHLIYYIIKNSTIWDKLKKLLLEKVKHGLEIRLIFDDIGRWEMPWYEFKDLRSKNIEIKIQNKIYFPFVGANTFYTDHRKLVIIDGEIAHISGANLTDEYISMDPKYGFWIDSHIRIYGPPVLSCQLVFLQTWNNLNLKPVVNIKDFLPNFSKNKVKKNADCILLEDGPNIKENRLLNIFIDLINRAKHSIKIASPFLIPIPVIKNALLEAAKRKVDIEIFLPNRPDRQFTHFITIYWMNVFLKHNIKCYWTNNIYIHSKIYLFDEKIAVIGSFNLDYRSFFYQWEIAALMSGQIIKKFKQLFVIYKQLSTLKKLPKSKIFNITSFFQKIYINFISPIL